MTSILYSTDSRIDLVEIWEYVAETQCRPVVASRLIDRIVSAIDRLGSHPRVGTDFSHRSPGVRAVVVGSYVVYHRYENDCVIVLRVLHGARDAGSILEN